MACAKKVGGQDKVHYCHWFSQGLRHVWKGREEHVVGNGATAGNERKKDDERDFPHGLVFYGRHKSLSWSTLFGFLASLALFGLFGLRFYRIGVQYSVMCGMTQYRE